ALQVALRSGRPGAGAGAELPFARAPGGVRRREPLALSARLRRQLVRRLRLAPSRVDGADARRGRRAPEQSDRQLRQAGGALASDRARSAVDLGRGLPALPLARAGRRRRIAVAVRRRAGVLPGWPLEARRAAAAEAVVDGGGRASGSGGREPRAAGARRRLLVV